MEYKLIVHLTESSSSSSDHSFIYWIYPSTRTLPIFALYSHSFQSISDTAGGRMDGLFCVLKLSSHRK